MILEESLENSDSIIGNIKHLFDPTTRKSIKLFLEKYSDCFSLSKKQVEKISNRMIKNRNPLTHSPTSFLINTNDIYEVISLIVLMREVLILELFNISTKIEINMIYNFDDLLFCDLSSIS